MLVKDERPDPMLMEEVVDMIESEVWAVVGCLGSLQQLADQQLTEGCLEKEERGSEQSQQRGCFAVAAK